MKAERLVEAGDARVYGVCRGLFAEENQAPHSQIKKVGCRQISGAAIVYADEVVRGALRVGHVAAVQEHEWDLRTIERTRNAAVGYVLVGCQFKRREEY